MQTRMYDLPPDLVGEEILTRIPISSLRAVRSTCKSWNALTKICILSKSATTTQQFLGIITNMISSSSVDVLVRYALGYDIHRNHKILRFVDSYLGFGPERLFGFEIYEFSSDSWRVLKVIPDWEIHYDHNGVSVKGDTYYFAREIIFNLEPDDEDGTITEVKDFLLYFDFTSERFGPRLPLPFHSYNRECVTLSSVRDEQLAVLYYKEGINDNLSGKLEIWVTTTIEPTYVSWSKFLKVDMRPFALSGVNFDPYNGGGSFFVDDENKVVVVFV